MFRTGFIFAFCIFVPLCTLGANIDNLFEPEKDAPSGTSPNCNTEGRRCHTGQPNEVCSDLPICWGDCYNYEYCKDGEYAIGFSVKIEDDNCHGDCTALNGVTFYCGKPGGTPTSVITSGQQKWGSWQNPKFCVNSYIYAFQMWYQNDVPKDDTASGTIAVWCSDTNNTRLEIPMKNTFQESTWSQQRSCLRGYAVAGIRTQYEKDEGVGDDTAMNNMCVICVLVQ